MKVQLILLTIILLSCTKEVSYNIPTSESVIIINGIFSSDTVLELAISENSTLEPISNAKVLLYQNAQERDTLSLSDKGHYTLPKHLLSHNQSYTIEVSTDAYGLTSASSEIPSPVLLTSVTQTDSTGFTVDNQSPLANIEITFDDSPDVNNFYEISVVRLIDSTDLTIDSTLLNYGFITHKQYAENILTLFSSDPAILEQGFSAKAKAFQLNQDQIFFNDDTFQGKTKTISFDYIPYYEMSSLYAKRRTFRIEFRAISKEYYNYVKSWRISKQLSNQTDLWRSSDSYIQLYSNINNGFGIFAGYTSSSYTLIIEK